MPGAIVGRAGTRPGARQGRRRSIRGKLQPSDHSPCDSGVTWTTHASTVCDGCPSTPGSSRLSRSPGSKRRQRRG
jgi:hypothetical protein